MKASNAQDQKRAHLFADDHPPIHPVFCSLMLARLFRSKHRLQYVQSLKQSCLRQNSQPLHQSLSINSAKLIRDDMAILALKCTSDAEWIWMSSSRQRSNNESFHMGIEFVWRHDHARPHLSDLLAAGLIQSNQEDISSGNCDVSHHSHSSSSNRVAHASSRSPFDSKEAAASAHPARGFATGVIVRTPGEAWISTSSVKPTSSRSGLARRMPREFPILTSFALTEHPTYDVITL